MRGIEGLRASLMGRDAELATLREAMLALTRGVGNVLDIIGEAGLGKSRLLAELRVLVPSNMRWAEGRALSYTSGMSYWLAQRVVLSLLGLSADAPAHMTAEALRRSMVELEQDELLPYLARMLDLPMQAAEEEEVKYLTGEALQSRILEAVREFVCSRALQQPLILVWEDLHWCDPSSKQVLKTLQPLTRKVPLLILSAARPEGKAADLDESESVRIRLSPLTRDESGSLIQELLQIENLPARTRDVILGRAEGNPFFLEELLRALIDAGVVVMEGGRAIADYVFYNYARPVPVPGAAGLILFGIACLLRGRRTRWAT
jgi:predicted ATPase